MQLERLLKGLDSVLEAHELTGVGVGSIILCSVLDTPKIYASFVVKGIRYVRDDWMSSDGLPCIQLVGDYFGLAGIQTCSIVLSRDDGAGLKLYEGFEDFASDQEALSIISETVLVR